VGGKTTTTGLKKIYGHSYKIRLHLLAELDKVRGWTVDYGDVKRLFEPVYDRLDHNQLDKIGGVESADIKHLLPWLYHQLSGIIPQLDRIDLYEKPGFGGQLCWGKEGPAIPD